MAIDPFEVLWSNISAFVLAPCLAADVFAITAVDLEPGTTIARGGSLMLTMSGTSQQQVTGGPTDLKLCTSQLSTACWRCARLRLFVLLVCWGHTAMLLL